ncbi:MAG: hypothetical protein ABIT71_11475 [Vicinamibacteraceae bacterium]
MARPSLLEPARPLSTGRTVARVALGAMLLFTGISHLTFARREFIAQVPRSLPLSDDAVVLLSGAAELLIGASLVALPTRRVPVGLATAAFFVAIFPGNIAQYLNGVSAFGLDTDGKRLARLFFQPALVAWALHSTGAWEWLRDREPPRSRRDRVSAPSPGSRDRAAPGPDAPS